MSLTTQLAIEGHLSVQDICHRLRTNCVKGTVSARPRRVPDHWTVEFQDENGEWHAIDAFLNSYAAQDHPELGVEKSTLVAMPLGAISEETLSSITMSEPAWIRRHEQAPWRKMGGQTDQY